MNKPTANPPSTTALPSQEEQAQNDLHALLKGIRSAVLGTVDSRGSPEASYAPVILDDSGAFYVYVSELAKHANNLKRTAKASLMLIEDESATENLHARRRATWNCQALPIPRDSQAFSSHINTFIQRFGSTMEHLATMQDFTLFQLTPASGRLVLGFGKAFRLQGLQVHNPMRGAHRPDPKA
jgi:putative heme iron utilization protein